MASTDTIKEMFDERVVSEILQVVLDEIYKDKTKQLTDFFEQYKADLSEINFWLDKKIISTINIPLFLTIDKTQKILTVKVHCNNKFDNMLLEMANSGVISIRKAHIALINKLYDAKLSDKQDLYMEPNSRLDIFYKKCIEISTNV